MRIMYAFQDFTFRKTYKNFIVKATTNRMNNEISSDVGYLINQINEITNNRNELEIVYGNEKINGTNSLTKEQTQQQPIIKTNKQFQDQTYRTLVCYISLIILSYFFFS